MKSKNIIIANLFIIISVSCANVGKEHMRNPVTMNVVQIPTKDITSYQRYTSSIEGINTNAVRSKTQGYIEEVYIIEGQAVKKGQALFRL